MEDGNSTGKREWGTQRESGSGHPRCASGCAVPERSLLPQRRSAGGTPGILGTRIPGILGTRTPEILRTRIPGILGTRTPGNLGTRTPGILGTRTTGNFGTRTTGILGTWIPGILGTRIPRILGTGPLGILGTQTLGIFGTQTLGILGTWVPGILGTGVTPAFEGSRSQVPTQPAGIFSKAQRTWLVKTLLSQMNTRDFAVGPGEDWPDVFPVGREEPWASQPGNFSVPLVETSSSLG